MGLRGSNIVASVLLLVGNWIRYAGTVSAVKNYGVVMFGQIVIGLAQPFCLSTPSKFSDSWFTDQGRTSATAIATLANPLGAALGQFANPYLAKIPDDLPRMVLIISIIVSDANLISAFQTESMLHILTTRVNSPQWHHSLLYSSHQNHRLHPPRPLQ